MWKALCLGVLLLPTLSARCINCNGGSRERWDTDDGWGTGGGGSTKGPCDNWNGCNGNGGSSSGSGKQSRVPQMSFADIAELKCLGRPYTAYFDREKLICVTLRPISVQVCEKIFGASGTKTVPASLIAAVTAQKVMADGTTTTNCVYKFAQDCESNPNAVAISDRCIEVVTTQDTINNAANACKKKGYSLFVPHKDSDMQLLLRHLLSDSKYSLPAFWLGQSAPSDVWLSHDNTTADFFRWKANRTFLKEAQGGQFVMKPVGNVNIGYVDTAKSSTKAPYICSRYRDSDYTAIYTDYINPGTGGGNDGGTIKDSWDTTDGGEKNKDGWDYSYSGGGGKKTCHNCRGDSRETFSNWGG